MPANTVSPPLAAPSVPHDGTLPPGVLTSPLVLWSIVLALDLLAVISVAIAAAMASLSAVYEHANQRRGESHGLSDEDTACIETAFKTPPPTKACGVIRSMGTANHDKGRGQVQGLDWGGVDRTAALAEKTRSLAGLRDAALMTDERALIDPGRSRPLRADNRSCRYPTGPRCRATANQLTRCASAPPPHRLQAHGLQAARGAMSVLALLLSALTAWPDPAARIGGEEALTLADLHAVAAPAIEQHDAALRRCQLDAERSRDEALQTILRDLVHARLRTMAAARLGLSAEALAARIDEAAEPVTDADVSAFHRARGITEALAEIGPQIRAYLERQAVDDARAVAYAELERRYAVAYLLEPLRIEVAADGFPARGPADAPVTIVEFSDFECPYCARLTPVLHEVERRYGDTVRIVYRHYPLTVIHPNAWKAAEASLCAGEQGRFWELHDLMFAEQGALAAAELQGKAERLDLDAEAFGECLDSGRYYDAVLADVRAGDEVGVFGTPAMFVNGRFLGGAVPFAAMAELIDDELRRMAQAAKAKKHDGDADKAGRRWRRASSFWERDSARRRFAAGGSQPSGGNQG